MCFVRPEKPKEKPMELKITKELLKEKDLLCPEAEVIFNAFFGEDGKPDIKEFLETLRDGLKQPKGSTWTFKFCSTFFNHAQYGDWDENGMSTDMSRVGYIRVKCQNMLDNLDKLKESVYPVHNGYAATVILKQMAPKSIQMQLLHDNGDVLHSAFDIKKSQIPALIEALKKLQ